MNHKKWINLLLVLIGNIIYAFSVKLFVLPANLMSCGTTGIGLVMNQVFGIPLTGFIFVFNIVMLALGWWGLGRSFAMTTVISSLFYPIALELLNRTLGDVIITEDILLNVLFAGMGLGIALGIVYQRSGNIFGPMLLHFMINFIASMATFGL